jgi:23S rRNA pseudouridine1911/1915/1917 synthase
MLSKVKVVFEDEFLIAIDKPSGLVVHNDGRTEEESLVDWIKKYLGENQKNIGNKHTLDSGKYEDRWGILNRLDRETSGIILIAKDLENFEYLQENWRENVVKKYVAVLHGGVNVEGLLRDGKITTSPNLSLFKERNRTAESVNIFKITEPLSRHKKDPRIWVLKSDEGSRQTTRDAETDFIIIKNIEIRSQEIENQEIESQKFTIVNFWPVTGRTHQLRLHAKFLGNPILGDKKYSFGGIDNVEEIDRENRLMLHAESVEFIHPKTKEKIILESVFDFKEYVIL